MIIIYSIIFLFGGKNKKKHLASFTKKCATLLFVGFLLLLSCLFFFLFFVLLLVGLTMRLSFCSLSYSFPASVGLNDDAIFYSLSLSFSVWLDCEAFFSLTFSFLPSGILLPHTSENYLGERESMLQLA